MACCVLHNGVADGGFSPLPMKFLYSEQENHPQITQIKKYTEICVICGWEEVTNFFRSKF